MKLEESGAIRNLGGTDSPELIERAAQLYYLRRQTQQEIADQLKIDQPKVARLLRTARDTGVVEFSIDKSFAVCGEPDELLEGDLAASFSLDSAFVQAFEPGEVDWEGEETSIDRYAADDLRHVAIANYAGREAVKQINAKDHIALAGGRAVYRTVQFIRRQHPPKPRVRISPLGGRIWAKAWKTSGVWRIERPLDADDCAFVLAQAFESQPGTSFSQIGHALYTKDPTEAQRIIHEHCAFEPDGSWKSKPPERAICGVGVVDPQSGHRMSDICGPDRSPSLSDVEANLENAAAEVRRIIELARKAGLPYPGDVANRIFPSLPFPDELPSDLEKAKADISALNELISRLNGRSVVMGWCHLRAISHVWAVAGGAYKANALWTLLLKGHIDRESFLVSGLSTDAENAEKLVAAVGAFDGLARAKRRWYEEVVSLIFGLG
jgi:DNA-binding transcriptional regulator LsrR (DeoR family)